MFIPKDRLAAFQAQAEAQAQVQAADEKKKNTK
jgi:hypothetical protein